MLSDYKRYLLKIRNSLIRCGVELEIKDTLDYEETFYLGEKLSDLLWFYSILEISGSEDRLRGFIFPLNSFYKNSLRDKYYEDYLIYRAEYMEISASDAILRDRLEDNKKAEISEEKEKVLTPMPNTMSFIQNLQSKYHADEDDEFLDENVDEEEFDDGFGSWGNTDIEEEYEEDEIPNSDEEVFEESSKLKPVKEVELDDDEFVSYGSDDDESSSEDDEFINWGNDDIEEVKEETTINWDNTDSEDEDDFGSWGTSDDEDEFIENTEEYDEEDSFGSWGSNGESISDTSIDGEEEEDSFSSWGSNEEEDDEEDTFGSWGSSDDTEEDAYTSNEDNEDFEDDFGTWGSSDEALDDEEEDTFGSWGSSDDEESDFEDSEEDAFGNWGSNEESSAESEDSDRSDFGSWGDSLDTSNSSASSSKNGQNQYSKKSKIDYEIESNEKTAKVIEKIALGIFSKGNIFKSKVSEKIKNMDENQD